MTNTNNIRNIKVKDFLVSYSDAGPVDSQAVIFIHGFPLNKSMWNGQADVLKSKYRVIAYDVRGHGNSEFGKDSFTVEQFARDLINFMDILRIEKAALCGLSMGGYIALNAILNYPERFDALILCDTNCIADTPETREKRMKTIETTIQNGVEKFAEDNLKNLFAPQSFMLRKEEITAVKQMMTDTSKESLVRTLRALSEREETCSKLHKIKVPVLIMVGELDTITSPSEVQRMHEKIRGSMLKIITNAGHMSNLENPTEFNDYFLDFVNSIYG